MAKRRDTYTALLFLAGIFAAAIFLLIGLFPTPEFVLPGRPVRPTLRTRPSVIASATPEERETMVRPLLRSVKGHLPTPIPTYEEVDAALMERIDAAEPAVNELLDREHTFIQLYGGVQRLLGRRVVEDADPQYTVVKLTDQMLAFIDLESGQMDMTNRAQEMIDFARRVRREFRTPVLYVQAPSKLNMAPLPEGITDYTDAEADQFLALLAEGKVDTLDLRPIFQDAAEEDPLAVERLFFHTDHHWTPEGAFLVYQALCEKLDKDYRFKIEEEWVDYDAFDRYTFEDVFLGSQGRRVGSLYAGLDDLEIWSPKFSTDFTYTVPIIGIEREGPFAISLLFPERLSEKGYYTTNPYTIYAGGDYLLSRALNEKNPNGKRILILRDSFGCALTPFLSIASQEVMAIDPRSFNGDQDIMMDFVDWLEPDLIIVMNTTGSLRVDKLYPYLPTARKAALAAKDAQRQS